jgi:hypothetical protein
MCRRVPRIRAGHVSLAARTTVRPAAARTALTPAGQPWGGNDAPAGTAAASGTSASISLRTLLTANVYTSHSDFTPRSVFATDGFAALARVIMAAARRVSVDRPFACGAVTKPTRVEGRARWRGSPVLAPEEPKEDPNGNFRPSGCG